MFDWNLKTFNAFRQPLMFSFSSAPAVIHQGSVTSHKYSHTCCSAPAVIHNAMFSVISNKQDMVLIYYYMVKYKDLL